MARRPVLDPLRRTFESADWVLFVLHKRGDLDAILFSLLAVYGIYFYDPYPQWLPDWRVLDLGSFWRILDLVYFGAAVTGINFSIRGWMFASGFMRARVILSMYVDHIPWYRCWVRPNFLLALVLLHLVGIALLLLPGWLLLDIAGRYELNGNVVYETFYDFYTFFGAAGRLVPPGY